MTAKAKERKVQPGVIGHPTTQYVTTKEVMELLGVKDSKAGDIIKSLRKELVDKDMITATYPAGKVPRQYFYKRCMIEL